MITHALSHFLGTRWARRLTVAGTAFVTLALLAQYSLDQAKAATPKSAAYRPRGERRIVMYYDPWMFGASVNPNRTPLLKDLSKNNPDQWKRAVEAVVDAHASAEVDTIVHCVFAGFTHLFPPSFSKVAYHVEHSGCWGTSWGPPMKSLHERGYDFVQIALDRAHENGTTFIAALRMNDRHGCRQKERMYKEKPQWHLNGFAGGFDYAKPEVREAMLTFVGEVLEHYDVDGIEYDWLRWVHVFERGTERDNAPLLTDFMRRTRQLLDEAGRRRGRRLLLGARVPDVLEQCGAVGFDVEQWVRQSLVDYLVPSHFGHMDYNMRVEDFRRLTQNTKCRIYPSMHGVYWTGHTRVGGFRPPHYRAAAHNFYAFGADGIATYNYQGGTMEQVLPRLRALTPMRDPKILAEYDRDYRFFRRRSSIVASGEAALHYDVIHLDRAAENPRGTFEFRLGEDLSNPKVAATMRFVAVGANEQDVISVELNGQKVAAEQVSRLYFWDGTQRSQGKERAKAGHEPYYEYSLLLSSPPMVFGANELALSLSGSSGGEGVIRIDDVQVAVHVR